MAKKSKKPFHSVAAQGFLLPEIWLYASLYKTTYCGPQERTMGKREAKQILRNVLRLCGHPSTGPSEVCAQSIRRISAPSSPDPVSKSIWSLAIWVGALGADVSLTSKGTSFPGVFLRIQRNRAGNNICVAREHMLSNSNVSIRVSGAFHLPHYLQFGNHSARSDSVAPISTLSVCLCFLRDVGKRRPVRDDTVNDKRIPNLCEGPLLA